MSLPEARSVTVAVYDLLGRRVARLHDGPLGAGRHPLVLDTAGLPAGVYVARMEADDEVYVRQLTVVH